MSKKRSDFLALGGGVAKVEAEKVRPFHWHASLFISLFVFLFTSCTTPATSEPLPQVSQGSVPIKSSVQIVTSTPVGKFIGASVPSALRMEVEGLDVRLDISTSSTSGSNETQIPWVYALVAPFPTLADGVTAEELKAAWTEGIAPA